MTASNTKPGYGTIYYHLPGLFEFYGFYREFLPLYREHREYFYDSCEIASIYGAPADCLWGGGRIGCSDALPAEVFSLMRDYAVSPRLTFSNSLLKEEHLSDRKCNRLCSLLQDFACGDKEAGSKAGGGVIVHSDLLLGYLRENYPGLYYVSSTTKVITDFEGLLSELNREEFSYVVPDFRLSREFDRLKELPEALKDKVEFLCNECCDFACRDRRKCYENVSRKILGETTEDHICISAEGRREGYRFSRAMENPGFIGIADIFDRYLPMGFSNFKIEGRGLGTAVLLEFLLYYMVKPEYWLKVREELYLDSMLDLF